MMLSGMRERRMGSEFGELVSIRSIRLHFSEYNDGMKKTLNCIGLDQPY